MQILLVAATEMEIAPYLLKKPAADFLVTGLGTAEAVYHITKRLQQIDYDLVIQAGIAGSFTESIALGEVVLVERDRFADLGMEEQNNFFTIFEKGFANPNVFPFASGWLSNDASLINSLGFKKLTGLTVNKVTDNKAHIAQLVAKFKPDVESMEGAALHYVCLQEKVAFLQLRSISNFVGERDRSKWKMQEALSNLNNALISIIEKLTG